MTDTERYEQMYDEIVDLKNAINRQKAEIERLITELYELAVENERLDDIVSNGAEVCSNCHLKYAEKIEQTKTEAVKEFAERLRYVSKQTQSDKFSDRLVTVRDIDDIEEEMVGEG